MVAGITAPVVVDGDDFVMFVDSIGYATVIVYHGNPLNLKPAIAGLAKRIVINEWINKKKFLH